MLGIAACSGGDDDDDGLTGNGELSTGTYEASNTAVVEDECNAGVDGIDGATFDVEVGTDTITFSEIDGTYDEGVFEAGGSEHYDLNDDPFGAGPMDCQIDVFEQFAGATTAEDEADVTYAFAVRNPEGPECDDAAATFDIPFPCESSATFHISPYIPPPPVNGTLSLIATGGQLTIVGDTAVDSGFTLEGIADGTPFSEPNDTWTCYAPDPPTYPNYDLFIGATNSLSLSIPPGLWAVGSVPLSDIEATFNYQDGGTATLTSGDLMIVAAPMTVDSAYRCAVQFTDIPFSSQAAFAPEVGRRFDPMANWHSRRR